MSGLMVQVPLVLAAMPALYVLIARLGECFGRWA
jgi:hypothetical protein